MSVEIRDVVGWPGYRVGADGSVWTARVRGRVGSVWRPMKIGRAGRCYQKVMLCSGAGNKPKGRYVHHLVLEAFVGPCPVGMEAIHKNDVQADNRLENLEWGTHKRNCALRRTNGKDRRRLITDEQARWIVDTADQIDAQAQADRLGLAKSTVYDIRSGRTWKHISRKNESQI